MAIANRTLYPYHLEKEISKIWLNSYADTETEFTKVAKVENAPAGNTYTEAEVSGLGPFREMVEGGAPDFDTPVEGNKKTITYDKFGLGFQITEEMVVDAIHPNVYKMPQTLSKSAVNTQELKFWDLLNGGHDTHESADGQYIIDTHTTLKSGDSITNDVQADLSETAFQAAFEYFDEMVDAAGLPTSMKLDMLIVPTASRWIANRLLRQRGGISAADTNAVNMGLNDMTTNPGNGYVDTWKLMVSRFIDDDDSWFALSNDHDLRFYWKKRPKLQSGDDFLTDNALFKMVMRFKATCYDYRGIYGSQGA